MNGDLAKAAQAAAATTEKVLTRLLEAEKVVTAANYLMEALGDDDQNRGILAMQRLREALDDYNPMRAS